MSDKQRDQLLAAYLLAASDNITKEGAWKSRKKAPKGRVYSKGKWVKKKKKKTVQSAMDKEAFGLGLAAAGAAGYGAYKGAKGLYNMVTGGNKSKATGKPLNQNMSQAELDKLGGGAGAGAGAAATPPAATPPAATPPAATPPAATPPAATPPAATPPAGGQQQPFTPHNWYQQQSPEAQKWMQTQKGFQVPQAPQGGQFGAMLQQYVPSLYNSLFGQQGGGQGGGQGGAGGQGGGSAANAGGGGGQAGGSKFDGRGGYNKLDPQMQAYLQQHGFKMPAQQKPADTSQADVAAGKADAQTTHGGGPAGAAGGGTAGAPQPAGAAGGGTSGTQYAKYDEYGSPTQDDLQNSRDLWGNQTGTVADAYGRNEGNNDLNRKWTHQTATQLAGLRGAGYDTRGMSMKQVRDLHRQLKGGKLEQGTYSSDGQNWMDNSPGGAAGGGLGVAPGATASPETPMHRNPITNQMEADDPDAMSFDDIMNDPSRQSPGAFQPDVEAGRTAAGGKPSPTPSTDPTNETTGIPRSEERFEDMDGPGITRPPVGTNTDTGIAANEEKFEDMDGDFGQGQQDAMAGSAGGGGAGAAGGATGQKPSGPAPKRYEDMTPGEQIAQDEKNWSPDSLESMRETGVLQRPKPIQNPGWQGGNTPAPAGAAGGVTGQTDGYSSGGGGGGGGGGGWGGGSFGASGDTQPAPGGFGASGDAQPAPGGFGASGDYLLPGGTQQVPDEFAGDTSGTQQVPDEFAGDTSGTQPAWDPSGVNGWFKPSPGNDGGGFAGGGTFSDGSTITSRPGGGAYTPGPGGGIFGRRPPAGAAGGGGAGGAGGATGDTTPSEKDEPYTPPSFGGGYTPMSGGPSVGGGAAGGRSAQKKPKPENNEPAAGGAGAAGGAAAGSAAARGGSAAARGGPPPGAASPDSIPGGFAMPSPDADGNFLGPDPTLEDTQRSIGGAPAPPGGYEMTPQKKKPVKPGRGGLPDNVSIGGTMGGAVNIPKKPSNEESDAPSGGAANVPGGFVMPEGPPDNLDDYTSGEYDIPGNVAGKSSPTPEGGEVVSPGTHPGGMSGFAKQFPGLVNKGDSDPSVSKPKAGPTPSPSPDEQIAGARQDMDAGLTDDLPSNVGGNASVPGGFASKQKDKNFANMEPPTQREPGTSKPMEIAEREFNPAASGSDRPLKSSPSPSDIAGSAGAASGAAAGATGAAEEPEAPAQQGGGRRGRQRPAGNKRGQPIRNAVRNVKNPNVNIFGNPKRRGRRRR